MSARSARWIRLGAVPYVELRAICAGLAIAQADRAAPIVVWAQSAEAMSLDLDPRAQGVPVARDCEAEAEGAAAGCVARGHCLYVLIVSRLFVPGLVVRWPGWALAPLVASYRYFGLPAYSEGAGVRLHGRNIATGRATTIGQCAVMASSFPMQFPLAPVRRRPGPRPATDVRAWLRERLALATTEWAARDEQPSERALEDVFRARVAAQFDWVFETGWPTADETRAIDEARTAVSEEPRRGRRRPARAVQAGR